jgi:hypothetical protein
MLSHLDTVRALFTLHDPEQFLFFTRTVNGRRAGKEFLALKERTRDRDEAISSNVPVLTDDSGSEAGARSQPGGDFPGGEGGVVR